MLPAWLRNSFTVNRCLRRTGFGFGWMVFQALFMRDMAGGSYSRSLACTIPELLPMNLLMTGMVPTMMILRMLLGRGDDPTTVAFWFVTRRLSGAPSYPEQQPISWCSTTPEWPRTCCRPRPMNWTSC